MTLQEREHTLAELRKMEAVRSFLLDGGAVDADGFVDFMSEIIVHDNIDKLL